MKINCEGETLSVSEITELGSVNSDDFRKAIFASLPPNVKQIEIDFSETSFMDCGGLGALISMCKTARTCNEDISIKLLNPTLPVRQMFKLTQMNGAFKTEIRI